MATFDDLLNAYKTQTAEQQFGQVFKKVGKYTSGFSAPYTGMVVEQRINTRAPSQNLLQKAGAVGSQSLDLLGKAIGKTASFAKNTAVDIWQAGYGAARSLQEMQTQPVINHYLAESSKRLEETQTRIQDEYRSGRMSRENYRRAIEDISKAFNDISEETRKIHEGPSPLQRGADIVETAVNVLSLGSFGLAEIGAKQAFKVGLIKRGTTAIDANAIKSLVNEAATPFEKLILKVPSARALVERNLTYAAKRAAEKKLGENTAQFLARESKNIAVDLLIKRPVFYQTNIADASKFYHSILEKNPGGALSSAIWMSLQTIEGGPLGVFAKGATWAKGALSKAAKGRLSVLDEVSKQIGNNRPTQLAEYVLENKKVERTARIYNELNLRIAGDDVKEAAQNALSVYVQAGVDLATVTPKMIFNDMEKWAKADELLLNALKGKKFKDVRPEDIRKFAVVRWDSVMKGGLANAIQSVGDDKAAMRAVLTEFSNRPGVGWGNNEILMNRLNLIINKSKNADEVAKEIKAIKTASVATKSVPKELNSQLAKLGYTVAEPFGGNKIPELDYSDAMGSTRKLVSAAINGEKDIFDPAIAPQPQISTISNIIKKFGLSPEAASKAGNQKLSQFLVAELDQIGLKGALGFTSVKDGKKQYDIANGGRAVLSKLQDYVENLKPSRVGRLISGAQQSAITDIRQLDIGDIQRALGVTEDQAKKISRSIMNAYLKVPLEFRGAGDRVVDALYAVNPAHKYYSRIQSALRYTYNPFFRTQERTETFLLSRVQGSNLLWLRRKSDLDAGAKILDDAGIFKTGLPGEAAQDQVFGRITANLSRGQKRDLAGLAMDMADARGLTLEQMVAEHADEIDDALRVVVQYPTKGLLASPLSRTINLAFFPMRYNAKVTQLTAQLLAKQPPSVQLAVLHSGLKMKDWLKSDEGIAWQGDHADAIQVFKWLTPVNSIEYTLKLLNGPDSWGDMGVLGGLPLGFITQILDSQGIIKLNRPYVQPATGDVFPDYVPQSAKARASVALVDLIGTMFTYPGRTLGLPGKEASIRKIVKDFIATNGSDFDKRLDLDRLTPLQKNMVRVLKGDTSEEAIDALYNAPAEGEPVWYTIPQLDLDVPDVEFKAPKSSSKKSKKYARRELLG